MRLLSIVLLDAFALATCFGQVVYTYDSGGHLTKADYGLVGSVLYTYDGAGNLVGRSVKHGASTILSVNTASGGTTIAQNTFIVITGVNLVPPSTPAAGVIWNTAPSFASGEMPTQLNGISVTVNSKPAYVYFFCSAVTSTVCTSDQINVLTPLDSTIGSVPIIVTSTSALGTINSTPYLANLQMVAPTFLLLGASKYVAATHANGSLIGPATLYPGSSTPAQPGETVVVYAVGFGLPATPLTAGSSAQTGQLPSFPSCTVANNNAAVAFAGVISSGLYQLNLAIPIGAPNGDQPISCSYGGSITPAGDLITISQ